MPKFSKVNYVVLHLSLSQQIQLSVQLRQHPGEIRILGLAYTLNLSSPHQKTSDVDGVPMSPPSPTSITTWNLGHLPPSMPSSSPSSSTSSGIFQSGLTSIFLTSTTPQVATISSDNDLSDSVASVASSTATTTVDPLMMVTTQGRGVKGKVLFDSEKWRDSGVDLRFQWTVGPPMALLKVCR